MKMITTTSMATTTSSPSSAAGSQSNAQLRKIKKPLIERRRRERINECLNQLKSLVLEAMNRDESCYSKMEKADILEMTVAHLRNTQRHSPTSAATVAPSSAVTTAEDALRKYLLGFNECAKEVGNYLASKEETAVNVGAPLMKHLVTCLESFQRAPTQGVAMDNGFVSDSCDGKTFDKKFALLIPTVCGNIPVVSDPISMWAGKDRFNMESVQRTTAFSESVSSVEEADCTSFDLGKASQEISSAPNTGSAVKNVDLSRFTPPTFIDDSSSKTSPLFSSVALNEVSATQDPRFLGLQIFPSSQANSCGSFSLSVSLSASNSNVTQSIKREIILPGAIWRPW